MRVPILSARAGWHTDQLCRALAERGHDGVVLPYERLVARLGTSTAGIGVRRGAGPGDLRCADEALDAGVVLARIIPKGSLEQIVFRLDVLHWLEDRGVRVMNAARAIERTVDKFYTSALLQSSGLPTPETVVCEGADEAMAAVDAMGDVVIKPLFGSMGHGLVRVSDPDVAFRVLKSLDAIHAVFYVQRVVEHGGRDIRVFVIGGRVLAAIERQAVQGDWRANVSRGAAAVPCVLPDEWAALACRAALAVGADYAGVDLLPAPDGVFVNEVNGIPGWQGLQRATGVDVAGAITDHLLSLAGTPVVAGSRAE